MLSCTVTEAGGGSRVLVQNTVYHDDPVSLQSRRVILPTPGVDRKTVSQVSAKKTKN